MITTKRARTWASLSRSAGSAVSASYFTRLHEQLILLLINENQCKKRARERRGRDFGQTTRISSDQELVKSTVGICMRQRGGWAV